jgi:hypothetical protein
VVEVNIDPDHPRSVVRCGRREWFLQKTSSLLISVYGPPLFDNDLAPYRSDPKLIVALAKITGTYYALQTLVAEALQAPIDAAFRKGQTVHWSSVNYPRVKPQKSDWQKNSIGIRCRVAALADLFQSKLWAAADPERRPVTRAKDELDLLRIAETYLEYLPQLPPALRARL